jgi:stage II sporulation protein D
MKKIIIPILIFLVVSLCFLNYECQETVMKIDAAFNSDTPKNQNLEKTTKIQETKGKVNLNTYKRKYVNILLTNNFDTNIYQKKIILKGKSLNVYYGKKYSNKTNKRKIEITTESYMFKKNNVLKIYSNNIEWANHNVEHNSPVYSGTFYIYKTSKGMVIVNRVAVDDYISKVVSSEIGGEAPMEALKAQAVCARTYILKCSKSKYKKYNAIADDSTSYQVYNRIGENNKTKKAAKATNGIVMTYENELINAYYFSTSCGYTTDYRIWGKEKKLYLQGTNLTKNKTDIIEEKNFKKIITKNIKSYEDKYPFYRWKTILTSNEISQTISTTYRKNLGKIEKIEILERGTGGIASQILVNGNKGKIIIKGQSDIRKNIYHYGMKIKLNGGSEVNNISMLPSAFIYIEKAGNNYIIWGGGFGHGSGMSQNAAIEMAKEGRTYDCILKKFYHKIELSK